MIIYYDEFSDYPNYKWYRNPVKWWKWRQLTKKFTKESSFIKFQSTPKGERHQKI